MFLLIPTQLLSRVIGLLIFSLSLPALSQTIVSAVGDSITAGDKSPDYITCARGRQAYGGYVQYLEPLLDNGGWPSTVYNYGIAGDRAQWAYKTESAYCTSTTWIHNGEAIRHNQIPVALARTPKPEYMLYLFGTNDLGTMHASDAVAYMKTGIKMIADAGVTPVVGTLLPDTRAAYDYKEITQANALLRSWLSSGDIPIAELYYATTVSGWASMMSDGLHPNATGQAFMADVWFDVLEGILEEIREEEEQARLAKLRPIAGAMSAINVLLLLDD